MFEPAPGISIPESEISLDFVRASGPGGQHLNKASTAVQLRFDVTGSPSLPAGVKTRLAKIAGNRMTESGELVLDAREHRSQSHNKQAALERLAELIRKAARPPKKRRRTRPTLASKRRRLRKKRELSEKKKRRKPPRRE